MNTQLANRELLLSSMRNTLEALEEALKRLDDTDVKERNRLRTQIEKQKRRITEIKARL